MSDTDFHILQTAVDKSATLCSIFDRVTTDGSPPPKKRHALEPSVLKAQTIVAGSGGVSSDDLRSELERLAELHPEAREDTYFYLLQKYGWRIGRPDGEEIQDEAFCDYYRVLQALKTKGDNGGYLLVKGDLSGIQEYIYGDIQQKTAGGLAKLSKRLRGRSILVTLLTDFLANITLRELELPIWNLLFAGGGHYNLLLLDTPEMQGKLKVLSEKLDSEMRRQFDDRLQLIVSYVSCGLDEITSQAGLCFERVNNELQQKKHRQHHKYLADHFYPSTEKTDVQIKDASEIALGQRFPKVDTLIEAVCVGPIFKQEDSRAVLTIEMHKYTYTLLATEGFSEANNLLNGATGLVSAQVLKLNDTAFFPESLSDWKGIPASFGFRFLGKFVPINEATKSPKTFEEIAQTDALEMLGAIRLDVDDLGYIFSSGMQDATLGRIVTLSREMHYFFSAHFDQLAQEHQLYLIYSGGDDAFAVGQWDNLIQFTRKLQADFQKFTLENSALHFSAGIFLGDPKYPVGRFYRDAGALLDAAKDSNDDKNRVHIFHNITKWEAFDKKIAFGAGLSKMLEKTSGSSDGRKLTMAFAYRLLSLVKSSFYERTELVDGIQYKRGSLNPHKLARNISRMHYLFARHGYDKAETDKAIEGIEKELITDFFRNFGFGNGKEQSIRDNLIALNYALYTIRSQKNINH
jgi:CRISPR-associated protein Csm1